MGVPVPPGNGGTYQFPNTSGFYLVVEGAPGGTQRPVGTDTYDPVGLPDLQIQVTQALGNGSAAVCDTGPPPAGGVPAIFPPDLAFSNVDAINDLACRFTPDPCIFDPISGEIRFLDPRSTVQFCALVNPAIAFPFGSTTTVTVRIADIDGVPGPAAQIDVHVGPVVPTATPTRTPTGGDTPSATPSRSVTPSPSSTQSRSPTVTPTRTRTATATSVLSHTAAATPTPTRTQTATTTAAPTFTTQPSASATPTAQITATSTPTSDASPSASTEPTRTPSPPPTPTATRTLISLDELIHAIFSPAPPPEAYVNNDERVSAADIPALLRLLTGG